MYCIKFTNDKAEHFYTNEWRIIAASIYGEKADLCLFEVFYVYSTVPS